MRILAHKGWRYGSKRQNSWQGAVIFGGKRRLPNAEFAIRK
ncbi:hypothetical protein X737_26930 [Mesorhizobium sp. L48C026A00]|nr:hypothetical protein X737_26930 [Mesorhizobium sp. L48C026A00]